MVDENKSALAENAPASPLADAETARRKRVLNETFAQRCAGMEEKCWQMFEELWEIRDSEDFSTAQKLRLWEKCQATIISLRRQAGPVVAQLHQAELLIQAYGEIIQKRVGPVLAEQIVKETGERFDELTLEDQKRQAEAARAADLAARTQPAPAPAPAQEPVAAVTTQESGTTLLPAAGTVTHD